MNILEEFNESLFNMSENTRKAYIMDIFTILREKFYHFWDFPEEYKDIHSQLMENFEEGTIDNKLELSNPQIVESKKDYLVPILQKDRKNIENALSRIQDQKEFWNYVFERKGIMQVLNHLYNDHKLDVNTIRRKMSATIKFVEFGVLNEWIDYNEIKDIPMPRIKRKEPVPLSKRQVRRLLDMPLTKKYGSKNAIRDKALLELLYGTGVRVSAVCNLKWKDINIDGKYMIVKLKRGSEVTKPLTEPIVKWLKEYQKISNDSPYVFPGRAGNMIERRSIRRIVKKYGAKLGVNISPHTLRSSLATHIAENGGDQFDVQQQLDHAHPITSESYIKVGKKLRNPMKYHPRK